MADNYFKKAINALSDMIYSTDAADPVETPIVSDGLMSIDPKNETAPDDYASKFIEKLRANRSQEKIIPDVPAQSPRVEITDDMIKEYEAEMGDIFSAAKQYGFESSAKGKLAESPVDESNTQIPTINTPDSDTYTLPKATEEVPPVTGASEGLMSPPSKEVSAEVDQTEADKPIKNEFIVSEVDAAPVPFSQNGRSGSAKGITKTFSVNGEERNITDVFETTKTMKPWKNQSGNVDVKNVVLHWTEAEYKYGVRHFLNSFESHDNVTAAYFIDKEGNIFQNFDPTKRGAHVAGDTSKNPYGIIKNDNSIGIEVEGTSENPPTEQAKKATAWLTNYIMGKYGAENVYAHPQANIHKGDAEGFDLLNAWRESRGLDPIIPKKGSARANLYTGE